MEDCIFCKIVAGSISSFKVYENEHAIAFMDVNPLYPGHTLVVSKKHYEKLMDTPDEELTQMMKIVKKVAASILKTTNSDGFNMLQNNHRCAGQSVYHIHFHIIPRKVGDKGWFAWKPQPADNSELKTLAEKIKTNLG